MACVIGSAAHFVAVPPERDDEPVREFASFTTERHRLADWLESRGFTVLRVNARHVKSVSGRKSDVLDCQWRPQLMRLGLLRGAFRPVDPVCVQHMQKALTQMNIQRANVISDVAGETGQKILRARNAPKFDLRTQLFQMCGVDLTQNCSLKIISVTIASIQLRSKR